MSNFHLSTPAKRKGLYAVVQRNMENEFQKSEFWGFHSQSFAAHIAYNEKMGGFWRIKERKA